MQGVREFKGAKPQAAKGKPPVTKQEQHNQQQQQQQQQQQEQQQARDTDYSPEEKVLRAFDLTTKFGPCIGMTRLARWERATQFGLDPPPAVKQILLSGGSQKDQDRRNKSLWHDRV